MAGYIAPIEPTEIQQIPLGWNPDAAFLQNYEQGLANNRAQAELAIKQQLLPSEINKNEASASYYRQRGDYFENRGNTEYPDPDELINQATSGGTYKDSLTPELQSVLYPKTSSTNSTSDTTTSNDSGSKNSDGLSETTYTSDLNPATAGGVGQNPPTDLLPMPKNSHSNLTPQDLIHLGIDPNTPLGSMILTPGGPTPGEAMTTIAQGLPITPENLGANSAGAIADASSSNGTPTAASDLGINPVMAARVASAKSAPVLVGGSNPLENFSSGQGLSKSDGIPRWVPSAPTDAATPANLASDSKQNNPSGVGHLVSLYDTQMNQYTQQTGELADRMTRLQRAARLLNPKDEEGRLKFVAAQIELENRADAIKRNAATITQDVSNKAGVDPQTLNFLRTTVRDPRAVDAVHQLATEKNLDHGSAFDFYKAQQAADRKQQLDPAAQQALMTKMLGDLKTVTDVKNSGNVTGDNYVKLQAQENALTDQINKLTGIQSAQPSQYVDPLDKFNSINTKLSALNASGVKTTDLDLGGGTKLTGVATDPNKSSAIIRPEIMKAAANNNALYDIAHIQDPTATPEIQRFVQDYNQAPAGKNYVITGLPGMIKKDPAIPAQQVLAAHFGAYGTMSQKNSSMEGSKTPLTVGQTAEEQEKIMLSKGAKTKTENPLIGNSFVAQTYKNISPSLDDALTEKSYIGDLEKAVNLSDKDEVSKYISEHPAPASVSDSVMKFVKGQYAPSAFVNSLIVRKNQLDSAIQYYK